MNVETVYSDLIRFSNLHSWYKHHPVNGVDYYPMFQNGTTPRSRSDPIEDQNSLHVWFTLRQQSDYSPIRFNLFLNGVDEQGHAIMMMGGTIWESQKPWLLANHPDIWQGTIGDAWDHRLQAAASYAREHDRQIWDGYLSVVGDGVKRGVVRSVKI